MTFRAFLGLAAILTAGGFAVIRWGPGAGDDWSRRVDPERGIAFSYPPRLPAGYVSLQEWPPSVEISTEDVSCREEGSEVQLSGRTEARDIDGRAYCINVRSEGAAGSVYTTYAYTAEIASRAVTFRFTLRFVQCGNYDEPRRGECEAERAAFDPDGLVARMAATFDFL